MIKTLVVMTKLKLVAHSFFILFVIHESHVLGIVCHVDSNVLLIVCMLCSRIDSRLGIVSPLVIFTSVDSSHDVPSSVLLGPFCPLCFLA